MKPILILIILTWLASVWFMVYGFGLIDHHNGSGQAYLIAGAILNGSSLISGILFKRSKF